jgi:urate oxidase/2-oxo-4-hydroxy-4-carboxy-5-ureidoimidazoline decarboxylase
MTTARISYGKLSVPVQRVGVRPMHGLPEVPESPLRSLDTGLLACEVSMEVLGQGFLASYTEGDNRDIVATDTMKNVILGHSLDYDGAVPEGLLGTLGQHFLTTYPEMEGLVLAAKQLPYEAVTEKVFRLVDGDRYESTIQVERGVDGRLALLDARTGLVGLRLLKTTGSAFRAFARDGDTTLPEKVDRPLFIHLDVHWRYTDPTDAFGDDASLYVAPDQVRDVVLAVFDTFVSESIQHLVHEIGQVMLARYPGLAEVSFRGENHTYDPVPGSTPGPGNTGAFTSPFPAWGLITLTLTR